MNNFERAAKEYKRTKRPSWDHTIETYQGNEPKTDWFMVSCTIALLAFAIGMLWTLV